MFYTYVHWYTRFSIAMSIVLKLKKELIFCTYVLHFQIPFGCSKNELFIDDTHKWLVHALRINTIVSENFQIAPSFQLQ